MLVHQLEQAELAKSNKSFPPFRPGDTVRVHVRIVEGSTERIQAFEGVCIARRRAGLRSSFTVRKISYGEGVERVFMAHSPYVERVELVRGGKVRRSKLYYMRGRRGKSARIAERSITGRDFVGRGVAAGHGGGNAHKGAEKAPTSAESAGDAPASAGSRSRKDAKEKSKKRKK